MSFLDEVRAKRKKLADVLSDDDYSGIREIVEELYPDRAHFIYELLQNAEDENATEAIFNLEEESLSFEHNGQPFTEQNVWDITNIGKGHKKEEEDKIGRFGVGFKAVFAYCETPHIWSPTFSFKISELVLPTALDAKADLGQTTRFEFPFNNPKKSAQEAYAEVKAGLLELAETTLLFLSHLKVIRWKIGQDHIGQIERVEHSKEHIEISKDVGKTKSSSHFLRFQRPAEGLKKRHIAVAFELEPLTNVTGFDPGLPLSKQLRIVAANPGRVSVFFPAEKEASGLRFHLNAPFVPELSRASIKETPVNEPLFDQVAKLSAEALHSIRELNLLTVGFLGVLPNPQDVLPPRYKSVRASIVEEMNNKPLTPTYLKAYAPAKDLLQAKASLKELLLQADIERLVDYEDVAPQWAIGAPQKNGNVDRFLNGLAIKNWDSPQFIELLKNKTASHGYDYGRPANISSEDVRAWLTTKPLEWHQQMYALLREELGAGTEYKRRNEVDRFKQLMIVRLANGSYDVGPNSFFPSDGVEEDEILPRVAFGVYTSGKSKSQQAEAKRFLEEIGVREVGEKEQVKAILDGRYTSDQFKPDMKDLRRFIALVEKDPQQAQLFADYFILKRTDEKWGKPSQVYLDSPFLTTGLSAYYDCLGEGANRMGLHESYQQTNLSTKRLLKFAESVGVQLRLEIEKASCWNNPNAQYLTHTAPGGWSSSYGINKDYKIEGLDQLLSANSEALSRLLWKTFCDRTEANWLYARFRNNSNHEVRKSPSQLVCLLRNSAWIPQTDGKFVRPSEANRDLLPMGFPFDEGYEWLKAIHFGEQARQRSEEHKKQETVAKELGFSTPQVLERAKQFAALPEDAQEKLLEEFQRRQYQELPRSEPRDPERRSVRVAQQASEAPHRITEERTRSVSVGLEDVKLKAAEYLNEQYTNSDGEMICQVCKAALPFKLDDGTYYFETVEFLDELKRRHYQNYLALCPNHGAMFRHALGAHDLMKEMFVDLETTELDVVLAQADETIYFTKKHIADLQTVIAVDEKLTNLESVVLSQEV